jgi:hypothetical protein
MNSDIREMPGPAVEVIERAPAHPAPSTIPTAASSSSACTTANVACPLSSTRVCFAYSMIDSHSDEDGVIGYHVTTVTPPKIEPIAAAALPSMMIFPSVAFIRSTRHLFWRGRFSFAYAIPLSIAATFALIAFCLPLNCLPSALRISSRSMPRSSATMPT